MDEARSLVNELEHIGCPAPDTLGQSGNEIVLGYFNVAGRRFDQLAVVVEDAVEKAVESWARVDEFEFIKFEAVEATDTCEHLFIAHFVRR